MKEIGLLGDHNKSHSEKRIKMYGIYALAYTEIVLRWQKQAAERNHLAVAVTYVWCTPSIWEMILETEIACKSHQAHQPHMFLYEAISIISLVHSLLARNKQQHTLHTYELS